MFRQTKLYICSDEYSIILYLKKTMMMTKSVKDAEIKKIKEEEKEENKEL